MHFLIVFLKFEMLKNLHHDYFILEVEFEISTAEEREDFIQRVKTAKSLQELPFMD